MMRKIMNRRDIRATGLQRCTVLRISTILLALAFVAPPAAPRAPGGRINNNMGCEAIE